MISLTNSSCLIFEIIRDEEHTDYLKYNYPVLVMQAKDVMRWFSVLKALNGHAYSGTPFIKLPAPELNQGRE